MNFTGLTTKHDDSFRKVRGLTWLPWVGSNFSQRPSGKKLLVVGESHYVRPKTPEQLDEAREQHLYPEFTRRVVSEWIDRDYPNRTLDNLPKLLFKTPAISRLKFSEDIGFYNLVQSLMNYNRKERPAGNDFVTGWKIFTEVVRIIQPSHCLFIGVTAANSFCESMKSQGVSFEFSLRSKVGGVVGRAATLKMDGTCTNLFFIKHLGARFSWSKWHDYLCEEHRDFMDWIQAESYPTNGNP